MAKHINQASFMYSRQFLCFNLEMYSVYIASNKADTTLNPQRAGTELSRFN